MESFTCGPALLTSSIFIAIIVLDLYARNYEYVTGHSIAGIVCLLLMAVLCQHGAHLAAYGLLMLPFVLVLIGSIYYDAEVNRIRAIRDAEMNAVPAPVSILSG